MYIFIYHRLLHLYTCISIVDRHQYFYYELKYKLLQICLLALLINIVVLDWVCKYNTHTQTFTLSSFLLHRYKKNIQTTFHLISSSKNISWYWCCLFLYICRILFSYSSYRITYKTRTESLGIGVAI